MGKICGSFDRNENWLIFLLNFSKLTLVFVCIAAFRAERHAFTINAGHWYAINAQYTQRVREMNIDYSLFKEINGLAGKIHAVDTVLSDYAQYSPYLFGMILLWIWFFYKEDKLIRQKAVVLAVSSAFLALGFNQIISAIYFRPRPFTTHTVTLLLSKTTDASFPSDHAAGSFALALALWWFLSRRVGYVMVLLAFVLDFSRVYAGTHYPFDIAGGIGTAILGTAAVRMLYAKLAPYLEKLLGIWGKVEMKVMEKFKAM